MTPPTQDDLAAGRELDAEVAKMMGWRLDEGPVEPHLWHTVGPDGIDRWWHSPPAYSTSIEAAWQVLDEMVWRVGTANIRLDMEDYGRGAGTAGRAERAVWVTIGEYTAFGPAPLAICRAALKAVSG